MQGFPSSTKRFRQRGSTLVMSMMILILIMMMGITSMVTSDTQYRLAGNLQFEDQAMNNAEAAIATAEQFLSSNNSYYASVGFDTYSAATPEQYPSSNTLDPLAITWSSSNAAQVGTDTSQMYYIQLISKAVALNTSGQGVGGRRSAPPDLVNTYLITARGTSARGSVKYVQSYYKVRLPT
jgi:Tfp pilus assembly protein PilX